MTDTSYIALSTRDWVADSSTEREHFVFPRGEADGQILAGETSRTNGIGGQIAIKRPTEADGRVDQPELAPSAMGYSNRRRRTEDYHRRRFTSV